MSYTYVRLQALIKISNVPPLFPIIKWLTRFLAEMRFQNPSCVNVIYCMHIFMCTFYCLYICLYVYVRVCLCACIMLVKYVYNKKCCNKFQRIFISQFDSYQLYMCECACVCVLSFTGRLQNFRNLVTRKNRNNKQ